MQAAKDALAQLEPPPDEIVVSTHSAQRSSWLRRDVVSEITRAAGGMPGPPYVADDDPAGLGTNVLVVANETVISKRAARPGSARAAQGPASF